ncbi:hypothetical protein [Candidatus Stoquefichus sp. SB1]|uniref:hypothetical protein n=1 Tax=Candidatus Stoquefichus sp. SB1 TaxID=1658109 RepID=UPI00067E92AA|nr:hypothetical protein [Candidatus Stoquefichus sp. SB1]
MIDIINNVLNSETVKIWVAPIVTGSIVVFLGYILRIILKRKKVVKELDTIKIAETKLVDIVRPFFIKKINLSEDVLFYLRSNIIKEYSIDDKKFMTLKDLMCVLIYDISNTMYIDEIAKKELIIEIMDSFSFLNEKETKSLEAEYLNFTETRKSLFDRKMDLSNKLAGSIAMFSTILGIYISIVITFPNMFSDENILFILPVMLSSIILVIMYIKQK